jgi:hypothetical protein
MPNITLKRFTGSVWEEMLPTPASHTHAIADVTGLQTALDGKAALSHTHTLSQITGVTVSSTEVNYLSGATSNIQTQLNGKSPTAGSTSLTTLGTVSTGVWAASTIPINRGGTGTTSVTAGGIVYGATGAGSYTNTAAPGNLIQYLGATFNGVNNIPAFVTPLDSSTRAVLSSSSTILPTERDIYWGTRYIHLGVTTVAGQNVSRTITFTSGMKNFILQLHQDTTTGAVVAHLPLTISNSSGTSTDATVYSLDTTTTTHRVAWSNGSTTQIMNVSISYSGTTITVSHNFAFNAAFRLFGF